MLGAALPFLHCLVCMPDGTLRQEGEGTEVTPEVHWFNMGPPDPGRAPVPSLVWGEEAMEPLSCAAFSRLCAVAGAGSEAIELGPHLGDLHSIP